MQNEGAKRGREGKGITSSTTPTLNSVDQTESQIIVGLNRSSVVIHSCLPSRVGRGRRRRRRIRRSSTSRDCRSLGGCGRGRGRGWGWGGGRRLGLGALEAIEGQETEEMTNELYVR